MPEMIGNFTSTDRILRKYDFTIRKKYGQNFLIDGNILEKIVDAAEVGPEDTVLEIGPGIGTLTQYLAARAKAVIAVEIDKDLIPILEDTLSSYNNVTVYNEDIMKFDIDACFRALAADGTHFKVVANLPYYITTPVMMKILEGETAFEKMLFMVQKEVAERILAKPGTEDYGALSLAAAYHAEITLVGTVPPSCFLPRPKVDSALVRFDMAKEKRVPVRDETLLFQLIRASFNQRRKTLANGIKNYEGLSFTREQVLRALEKMGLSETVRGETLSLEEFARLADLLAEDPMPF